MKYSYQAAIFTFQSGSTTFQSLRSEPRSRKYLNCLFPSVSARMALSCIKRCDRVLKACRNLVIPKERPRKLAIDGKKVKISATHKNIVVPSQRLSRGLSLFLFRAGNARKICHMIETYWIIPVDFAIYHMEYSNKNE